MLDTKIEHARYKYDNNSDDELQKYVQEQNKIFRKKSEGKVFDSIPTSTHTGGNDLTTSSDEELSDLEKKMLQEYTHPEPSQENFQSEIYKKRQFYINATAPREKFKTYKEVKDYRDNTCPRPTKLNEHQALLANFINPDTPYKGLLIFHGTGTGKSAGAIAIAENFKPMVEKYFNKIHVLVTGPIHKQNFMSEIIKFTGETYMKAPTDKSIVLDDVEMAKLRKNAYILIQSYYKIISYRSFYRKVLGEKIADKKMTKDNKVKTSYRKTESGEYERDTSIDRIYNLDNTLLIIDEAHNITGNEYGDAVKKIVENSKNLKIVLLTATPMKNLTDNIIELINLLRPKEDPILRDRVFNNEHGYLMDFREGGREYFRNMIRGYVSFWRGNDPITFAERVDMGEIPNGLMFTKVTRCKMLPFQLKTYKEVLAVEDDTLDRRSSAAANFVFPGLSRGREETSKGKEDKSIVGYSGIDGMDTVKFQIKNQGDLLRKKIASTILSEYDITDPENLLYLIDNKTLGGDIFKLKYLPHFSIKFAEAMENINKIVFSKRGEGIAFIYSNLVKVGIDLFQTILQMNGYLEYQENSNNYNIEKNTKCYYCGYTHEEHSNIIHDIPNHEFRPATYLTVTGKSDESNEQIPEEKFHIIKNVFNNIENRYGKNIKLILGSRVMNEGITLRNIKEIHILDVSYNFGKVDQVIGRGIRWCTHYDIIDDENKYPKVEIYKYVVSLDGELSSDEKLYQKAELKYVVVKETERIAAEEAIDCPLNRNGNIFPEELEKYKNCGTNDNPCPAICGYMSCDFKCSDKVLNAKYYDPERNIYRKLSKEELDYSTYNNSLAFEEVAYAKDRIKELYTLKSLYVLEEIIDYVQKSFKEDKRDLFDVFYVYKALNDMVPNDNNSFNNFKDTLNDRYNRQGYLIFRSRYYIFQPFNEPENLPYYYRDNYIYPLQNTISLKDYIHEHVSYEKFKELSNKYSAEDLEEMGANVTKYDYDTIQPYLESRPEFEYVGTIVQDKSNKETSKPDKFKLRKKRPKFLVKKREIGVPTFTGAVCGTVDKKDQLKKIAKTLKITVKSDADRKNICDEIQNRLFDLEKYSTGKEKMTYLIVPANHPIIPFPLNLVDRVSSIVDSLKKFSKISLNEKIHTEKINNGKYPDIKYVKYIIDIDKNIEKNPDAIKKYNIQNKGGKYFIEVS